MCAASTRFGLSKADQPRCAFPGHAFIMPLSPGPGLETNGQGRQDEVKGEP